MKRRTVDNSTSSASSSTAATKVFAGVGEPGSMYTECLNLNPNQRYFGFADIISRTVRVIVGYYACLCYRPLSFFIFMLRYNMLWLGTLPGLAWTLPTFFVWPLTSLFLVLVKTAKKKLFGHAQFDDGNVFFVPPSNPIAAILWSWYKELSPPVAQFLYCKGDKRAVQASWKDVDTTKNYWRSKLAAAGAHVPRELALWNKNTLVWAHPYEKQDIVIKLDDSYLGIGDQFLVHGDQFSTAAELEAILKRDCSGLINVHVLEWIRPAEGMEVHSLDILTLAKPNGTIEVCTVLFWGDCLDGKSTHSTQAGYVCDVQQEKIVSTCAWYSPYFANMKQKKEFGVGLQLPGLSSVVETAVACHQAVLIDHPWMVMCGWDAMRARSGWVFFEGNFAQMRLPRRVFLTWTNLWLSLRAFLSR